MSSCEVYAVDKNGEIQLYDEARNAWGGAMHIWNTLAKKYNVQCGMFDFYPLWKMYSGDVMSDSDKLVLGSTFDRVICQKEKLPKLIEALQAFNSEYPTPTLIAEIEILRQAYADDDVIGVAWNQTSVSEFQLSGDYDEETEEETPYNINQKNDHWFL